MCHVKKSLGREYELPTGHTEVEGDNIAEWCARITDAEDIQPNTTEYPYEGTVVISEAQYEVLKAAAEIIRKSRE